MSLYQVKEQPPPRTAPAPRRPANFVRGTAAAGRCCPAHRAERRRCPRARLVPGGPRMLCMLAVGAPSPACAARRSGAVPLRVTAPAVLRRCGGSPSAWRGPPRYSRGPLAFFGVRAGRAVAGAVCPGSAAAPPVLFSGLAGPLLWSRRPGGPCAPAAPRSARPPGLAPALGLALAARALPVRSGLLRCGRGLGAPRCGLFGGRPCGGPVPPRALLRGSAPAGGRGGLAGRSRARCAAPCSPPRLRRLGGLRPPGVFAAALRLRPRCRAAAFFGGCAALRPLWCRPRALALRSGSGVGGAVAGALCCALLPAPSAPPGWAPPPRRFCRRAPLAAMVPPVGLSVGLSCTLWPGLSPCLPPAPAAPLGLAGGAWLVWGASPLFAALKTRQGPAARAVRGRAPCVTIRIL